MFASSSLYRHVREFIGRAWPNITEYLICFGILRGAYFFLLGRIWQHSGGKTITVTAPGSGEKLLIRLGTADVNVFYDIYIAQEYGWDFASPPRTIVDAGAYTGLSAAFFASRYPEAAIIAIEPDEENFRLLAKNTSSFANVQRIRAALWTESCPILLTNPGKGTWGFTVRKVDEVVDEMLPTSGISIRAVTIVDIIREYGIDRIDLLKMDIEGSEKEIFSDADQWIDSVEAICMELHDRFKAGCSRAFFNAVNDFPIELHRGEDVLVVREQSPMRPVVN